MVALKGKFFFIAFVFCLITNLVTATVNQPDILEGPYKSAPIIHAADRQKKDWTIIIYMAADNDLRGFAARNIKQMALIPSNAHVNIVVHLDIRLSNNKKVTRRYLIEYNKITQLNENDPYSQAMDSGDPQTLISCCRWAISQFPANHYMLVFWNHGSGIIDINGKRIINTANLFSFNPAINKFELDRTVGFLELLNAVNNEKGICWDDTTGHYLTNQKLEFALQEIVNTCLNGQKIDIIGFDACLMAMLEVGNLIHNYANIMVASQEVELGTGWDYKEALAPFATGSPTPAELARNIVVAYEKTYLKITNDYTQSAVDLNALNVLETNVNAVSQLLISALRNDRGMSVKNAIRTSISKAACTHFDEPSYKDLHHFYLNLENHLNNMDFHNYAEGTRIKQELAQLLPQGRSLITSCVLANVAGKNLAQAKGISIYFPERKVDASYRKIPFAQSNEWINFITTYLLM